MWLFRDIFHFMIFLSHVCTWPSGNQRRRRDNWANASHRLRKREQGFVKSGKQNINELAVFQRKSCLKLSSVHLIMLLILIDIESCLFP